MNKAEAFRLPVVSLTAEYLAIGNLMRRNILAYKAPPNNEGYDLICIHPDPRRVMTPQIRVQVKSRYQTDSDGAFPVKAKSFDAFHYVIAVFLNIGYFYRKRECEEGRKPAEFLTLPTDFIRKHHRVLQSGWDRVHTRGLDLSAYRDEVGFEQIARDLEIPYPARTGGA